MESKTKTNFEEAAARLIRYFARRAAYYGRFTLDAVMRRCPDEWDRQFIREQCEIAGFTERPE